MNNAMQNILLEEMENFEGILIATTNLIPNLDNAFERRFLYKVEFTQPEASVRKEIWRGHFSWMEEAVLEDLSNRFNFSGGQIENIARKAKMNELLFLRKVNVPELIEMCEAELLTPAKRSMGFKAE
jgi:SpoVK/Ycf46/Vps4 family AAA+-type ATPase